MMSAVYKKMYSSLFRVMALDYDTPDTTESHRVVMYEMWKLVRLYHQPRESLTRGIASQVGLGTDGPEIRVQGVLLVSPASYIPHLI